MPAAPSDDFCAIALHSALPAEEADEICREALNALAGRQQETLADLFGAHGGQMLGAWRDRDGETLLLRAARESDAEWTQKLLPFSDPNAADSSGDAPLLAAARAGSADCVALLLPLCDPFARDGEGETALMRAALRGDAGVETIKLLSAPLALAQETLWIQTRMGESAVSAAMNALLFGQGAKALSALLEATARDPERQGRLLNPLPGRLARAVARANNFDEFIESHGLTALEMIGPLAATSALEEALGEHTTPDSILALATALIESRQIKAALIPAEGENGAKTRRAGPRL